MNIFDENKKFFMHMLFSLVILLWVVSGIVLQSLFPELADRGQFGDSFGVVNALFAGLAFAGVICAILLQMKIFELQRRQLELQEQEMQATRAEIKGQKETLQKQNFENSFFQLLGMHSEIVNSMAIENKRYSGRECFGYMLNNKLKYAYYNPPPNRTQEDLNALYEQLSAEFQTHVGYYFRHLYNVVKFVDQHDFFGDDAEFEAKKFYTNLVRAQLSSDELGLLFYNCLSDRGAKFKDLVEKYALFEDMPLDVLIKEEHKYLYEPSAYGES